MKKIVLSIAAITLLLTACATVDLDAPIPVYDTGIDTEAWATIPAGPFLLGQFDHPDSIDYDYEMMVTDVTNAQYARYLNEVLPTNEPRIEGRAVVGFYPGDKFHGGRHEEEIEAGDYIYIPLDKPALRLEYDGSTFSVKSGFENHPMTMVTWFGAKAYCEYYGWRLPTEKEWEKAARGTDGRPYPWGAGIARNNANFYASRDPFEDMRLAGSRTTPVGFYNGNTYGDYVTIPSASPYGLYDMAGDVWQWMADIYEQQHYRYMRGGSKDSYGIDLRVWVRNNARPTYYSPGVGFRCVRP